jgi:hypothetical protein
MAPVLGRVRRSPTIAACPAAPAAALAPSQKLTGTWTRGMVLEMTSPEGGEGAFPAVYRRQKFK